MNLQPWLDRIDLTTREFQDAFGNLNQAQLNWKPSADVWSIAQVINHLMVINASYYPLVAHVRAGTLRLPFHAKWPFMVRFFGKFVFNSIQPETRKKMRTFPMWEPASSHFETTVLTKFTEQQSSLKRLIISTNDLLDAGQVIHSPASKVVVYTLEMAYNIIITHELRHLEQARELKAMLPSGL